MAKEPARRYPTARELADDLRRWLNDEPIRARSAGRAERVWRWCRRNPGVAGLAAAVAVLLLAATGTAVWAAFQADARARVEAEAKDELAFNLYLRNIPRAREEALLGNWGEMEVLLDAVVKDCPEHLRGWEYDHLRRLPDSPLRGATARVNRGIGANLDLAFSPDGRLLAGPGPAETVTVWDLTTGRESQLPRGHTGQVLCVKFSPDGRLLVSAGRDGAVVFWDARTGGKGRTLEKRHAGEIGGMTFSPDGRLLATVGSDDVVRLWDVAAGADHAEFRTVYKAQARMLRRVAFSPDGRLDTVTAWS